MKPASTYSLEAQFLGGLVEGERRPTANLCTPGTHVHHQGRFEEEHCLWSNSDTCYGDQWVTVELLVEGSERFVHYVNGEAVIEYANAVIGGGVISGHDPAMKNGRRAARRRLHFPAKRRSPVAVPARRDPAPARQPLGALGAALERLPAATKVVPDRP